MGFGSAPAAEPPTSNTVKLVIANGALLEAPVYEKHIRGSNWMALIGVDAGMPGGLSREFLTQGRGECLYVVDEVPLFAPMEFDADYTTAHKKHRLRWYGVVIAKTDSFLMIEQCPTGARAVLRSAAAKTSREDRVRALEAQRDAYIQHAANLEGEITELRRDRADEPVFVAPATAIPVAPPPPRQRDPLADAALQKAFASLRPPRRKALRIHLQTFHERLLSADYIEAYDALYKSGSTRAQLDEFRLALSCARAIIIDKRPPEEARLAVAAPSALDSESIVSENYTQAPADAAADEISVTEDTAGYEGAGPPPDTEH
jgi:hypothetical protein